MSKEEESQRSLVYVNYTAKVKDTGDAVETTSEEESKKLGIHDQTKRYEPRLVAVGEGWVLKGLDEEIAKMEMGAKKSVELTPDKAYGERDPTQLRMIPLRKFGEKAGELGAGDVVEVENRIGVVRFVGSGRAQVDFNHRLAGKTLVYDVETVRKLETEEDKIRGLINRRFPGEGEKITFTRNDEELNLDVPEELFLADGLQIIKRGIANDISHFIPGIKKIAFREQYLSKERPAAAAEAKPKAEVDGGETTSPATAADTTSSVAEPAEEEEKEEQSSKGKVTDADKKKEEVDKEERQ
jgi:peptidylprolyl isomerase